MTGSKSNQVDSASMREVLRSWFVGPPRAHGEVDSERVVSFLELFYDLVFVFLIAQIAHTLAGDVSWGGVVDFVVVFVLIWIAWLNGSMYHELHGREDGRSRMYIFGQMFFLVLLSVYAAHATEEDGRGFAVVYTILLVMLALQWFGLRRYDTAEFAAATTRYVSWLGLVAAITLASAFVDDPDTRLIMWVVAIAASAIGGLLTTIFEDEEMERALMVTESMSERFGLFTIIVLGEVVVGVGDGLAESERTTLTVVTGLIALNIGFGFWWTYFDFVGRRPPRAAGRVAWLWTHLPLSLSIAAAGAGMVSLIEHAEDPRTPVNTAWLIAGATAAVAASVAILVTTIDSHEARRHVPAVLAASAGASLIVGALRPSPIVLAALLLALFSLPWTHAFIRHARAGTSIVDV